MSDESQQDRQEFGTDFGEIRHEPAASRWQLRLYVLAVLVTPFVLIAGSLWWMSLPEYARHAQYSYLADTGYGLRLKHADCDVVVYGDSSALIGVVPKVIEQRTGLKTCNIAEVAGIQVINGLWVLDTYLKNNRPPRFIVFDYVPENLTNAESWHEVSTFEGVFLRLQASPDLEFLKTSLSHLNERVTDAELGLHTGLQWLFAPPLPEAKLRERETNHGRVHEDGPPFVHCPPVFAVRAPDAGWLAQLRQEYAVHGTRVLIDVTPTAPCDPTRPAYNRWFTPGLIDNTLETMPVEMYTYTGRLHTTDAGAEEMSRRIADQILRAEGSAR